MSKVKKGVRIGYISVYGKDIPVIQAAIDESLDGLFLPHTNEIFVSDRLSGDDLSHTILHELIHAILHRVGTGVTSLGSDLEEMIVDNIAKWFIESPNVNLKIKLSKRKRNK